MGRRPLDRVSRRDDGHRVRPGRTGDARRFLWRTRRSWASSSPTCANPPFQLAGASTTPPDVKVFCSTDFGCRSVVARDALMLNFGLGVVSTATDSLSDVGQRFFTQQHARAFLHAGGRDRRSGDVGRVRGVLHLRLRDAAMALGLARPVLIGLFILLDPDVDLAMSSNCVPCFATQARAWTEARVASHVRGRDVLLRVGSASAPAAAWLRPGRDARRRRGGCGRRQPPVGSVFAFAGTGILPCVTRGHRRSDDPQAIDGHAARARLRARTGASRPRTPRRLPGRTDVRPVGLYPAASGSA